MNFGNKTNPRYFETVHVLTDIDGQWTHANCQQTKIKYPATGIKRIYTSYRRNIEIWKDFFIRIFFLASSGRCSSKTVLITLINEERGGDGGVCNFCSFSLLIGTNTYVHKAWTIKNLFAGNGWGF